MQQVDKNNRNIKQNSYVSFKKAILTLISD